MKVYELAKEMDVSTADVVRALSRMGVEGVTKGSQNIPDDILVLLKETVGMKPPKATKPWDSRENPWAVDLLGVQGKEEREREGFKCSWVSKDEYQRFIELGYKLANKKDYGGLSDVLPGEESENDTIIRRRELMLMETPTENWEEGQKFLRRKTKQMTTNAQGIAKDQGARISAQSEGRMGLTESRFTSKQGR